jgi:hypothetical protein
MKRLKQLLTTLLLTTAIASACWFTTSNFNKTYIAGVNNYFAHYTETAYIQDAIFYNGQTVAMPLTVFVKVSPRIADQPGESPGTSKLTRAILQYKILPDGEWVTVKDIDHPDWDLDFAVPLALFGYGSIDVSVPDNTEILIRLYLTDDIYETGDLETDITSTVPNNVTYYSGMDYEGGWRAPHVMRLKISGRRPFQ